MVTAAEVDDFERDWTEFSGFYWPRRLCVPFLMTRGETEAPEVLSTLLKVTQLENGGRRIRNPAVRSPGSFAASRPSSLSAGL